MNEPPKLRPAAQKVARYYNATAKDSERLYSTSVHFGYAEPGDDILNREKMLRRMTAETLRLLKLDRGAPIALADMGCGLGGPAFQTAKRFPFARIFGVNITPAHIERAEKRREKLGYAPERVTFVYADYQATPFADGEMDGVYSVESACYGEGRSKRPLLREMYRILKPGARFAVADGFVRKKKFDDPVFRAAYERLCKLWALEQMAHLGSFKDAAKEVGFRKIKVRDITPNTFPSLAYAPFDAIRLVRRILQTPGSRQKQRRRVDNAVAPLLMTLVAMEPENIGYFLVTGKKPEEAPKEEAPKEEAPKRVVTVTRIGGK